MGSHWESRFAHLVAHLLGTRETHALEPLPDLMPVLPVLDARQHETRLARGEVLFSACFDITAALGQYPAALVHNPSGSNDLVVLTRALIATDAAVVLNFGHDATTAGFGVLANVNTDDERRPNVAARTQKATGSLAAPLGGPRLFAVAANLAVIIPLQTVLPPGFSWKMSSNGIAGRLYGFVQGYERACGNAELVDA